MVKKLKVGGLVILGVIGLGLLTIYIKHHDLVVLNSGGAIGAKERSLMIEVILLMLIVVVPVFILTAFIAIRYRAGNHKAKYTPDWDGSRVLESVWWGIPGIIILILAVITWNSSHELDPFRQIASSKQPLKIQVVALQWKWLFIYPDQNIASVNYVNFPAKTPIDFEITSDAPMNSFWIPKLGGQVYAMAGMKTHLHLIADGAGTYQGSSANISGAGFAGMKFTAHSTNSDAEFYKWATSVSHSSPSLTATEYNKLAKPSENNAQTTYQLGDSGLYNKIVLKYMVPSPISAPASKASPSLEGAERI